MNLIKSLLFVGVGGALGSIFRYLISYGTAKFYDATFPLATFVTNSIGSLLIGFLYGYSIKNNLGHSYFNFLFITGLCGGFTTFSTFSYENFQFIQQNNFSMSLFYIISSIITGILFTFIGYKIIR